MGGLLRSGVTTWIVVGGVGAVVQPTEGARAPRAPNFARALGLLRAVAEAIELTFPVEGAIRTCSNPASRLARPNLLRVSLSTNASFGILASCLCSDHDDINRRCARGCADTDLNIKPLQGLELA